MNEIYIETINQLLISHHHTCHKAERTLHMHNNAYEILLFKSGNVDYFINGSTYHLMPGELLFICPNDLHGLFIKDNSPYERIPIHIEESFASSLSTPTTDVLTCFRDPHTNHRLHLSKEQMKEFEQYADTIITSLHEKSFGYDIKVKSCLSLILLLANAAHSSKNAFVSDISPQIIRDAFFYIDENLTKDISVQVIADYLSISRSRLSHLFKDFTGTSLWNYIIARRIQHAGTLLSQGASITMACYECGFKDYAHFVKVFSKINGISPGKFAKNTQTGNTDAIVTDLSFE